MAGNMYLLVLKATGHVLGAYSELPQGAEPTLEELCGTDFPVSSERSAAAPAASLTIALPREQLELRSAPLNPAVLANPRGYVADGGATTRIVASMPTPALTLLPDTIDVPGMPDKGLVALNRDDDPAGERRLGVPPTEAPFTPITLKTSPAAVVNLAISAAPGTVYDVLVALPGRPLLLTTETT